MSMFEFMKLSKKLDTILDSDVITNGAVKSVQRGDVDLNGSETKYSVVTKNITISPVNINKSIILVNWYIPRNDIYIPVKAKIVDATHIELTANGNINNCSRAHWQVIEFY